tara:strand:- start:1670 stop:2779 length:1110 start_codon:yes stop_codon:yes gene_type:complete
MNEELSSFPCPTLFTEGYGINSSELKQAFVLMQIELVVSEIVRSIEIKELGLGLSVRRRLFQEESEQLLNLYQDIPIGNPLDDVEGNPVRNPVVSSYRMTNPPPVPQQARCGRCGIDRHIIETRGNGMDFLEYRHMGRPEDVAPELICQSCCYDARSMGWCGGGIKCIDCGMSESFALNHGLPRFMEDREVWPRDWRCDGCWARDQRFEEELNINMEGPEIDDLQRREEHLMECENCGRIWDGNAQCPCLLFDEEEEPRTPRPDVNEEDPAVLAVRVRDEIMDQRIIQRLVHLHEGVEEEDFEEDGTYIGEYENEDWQPENNTEKVKEIKDSVKDIGEIVFDIREKISEGEYVKLMDSLQGLTNRVNEL